MTDEEIDAMFEERKSKRDKRYQDILDKKNRRYREDSDFRNRQKDYTRKRYYDSKKII